MDAFSHLNNNLVVTNFLAKTKVAGIVVNSVSDHYLKSLYRIEASVSVNIKI